MDDNYYRILQDADGGGGGGGGGYHGLRELQSICHLAIIFFFKTSFYKLAEHDFFINCGEYRNNTVEKEPA